MGTTGPQPQDSECNGRYWTSTKNLPTSVDTAGPQRPDGMPKYIPKKLSKYILNKLLKYILYKIPYRMYHKISKYILKKYIK